jgi:hypothetical protein
MSMTLFSAPRSGDAGALSASPPAPGFPLLQQKSRSPVTRLTHSTASKLHRTAFIATGWTTHRACTTACSAKEYIRCVRWKNSRNILCMTYIHFLIYNAVSGEKQQLVRFLVVPRRRIFSGGPMLCIRGCASGKATMTHRGLQGKLPEGR